MIFKPPTPAERPCPDAPAPAAGLCASAPPALPPEGPAHAVRTPLTALSGALALLGAGLGGELPGDAAQLLAIARRNCATLEQVLEQQFPSGPPDSARP